MAISYTSASIRALEGSMPPRNKKAGAACTVGYPVYLDSSGYVQHADADAGATESRVAGVLIASKDGETSIASGDRCSMHFFGPLGGFAGMTPGSPVYLDTTVGGYTHTAPTGGAYQQAIGRAFSATVLFVNPDVEDPESAS